MATAPKLKELLVKPASTDEEVRRANELMAKAHTENYFSAMRWFENVGSGYPGLRREDTRVAYRNGELAGALRVTSDTIRIGEARLKMGGLGWVTTAPHHRHRGVCTALINDTLRYLRDRRHHVSMLFGIPNFYHRFGYTTTLAEYVIVVNPVEGLASLGPALRCRPVKPGDIPAIQKIHAANDVDVSCSLLRSAAHLTNKWDRFQYAQVFTDDRGKVVAYVLAVPLHNHLRVEEVGVATAEASAAVFRRCAEQAREDFFGLIRFLTPPDHPFARFLLQYASIHETRVVREQGGMMTFVDLPEALESMIPEWERRLEDTPLRDGRCEITLVVDRETYRVRATKGAIDITPSSGKNKLAVTSTELMELVVGYRHIDDLLEAHPRLLTQEARRLLSVLFPKRNPYVWTLDRF